jgi:hypothetical protein
MGRTPRQADDPVMTTPDSYQPRDGRRTGATWVAATGVFLLFSAAVVFVAANWDHIPAAAKLAALAGLTASAIVAGDRLRPSLPATGGALFHLGALLLPVNVAAVDVRLGAGWRETLLHASVGSLVAFVPMARRARSVVLAAAASAAAVTTAGGIAALTSVPAPLALVAAAATLLATGRKQAHALVWAGVAGLAPLVAMVVPDGGTGRGVVDELGLRVVHPWPVPLVTGVVAAAVIALVARRRDERALLVVSAAAVVAHGVAAWSGAALPETARALALPSLFVLVEVVALAVRRDRFWSVPTRVTAVTAECIAAVPTGFVALFAALNTRDITSAFVMALVTVAWAASAVRNLVTPSKSTVVGAWLPAELGAGALLATVGFATGAALLVATTAMLLAVATVVARPGTTNVTYPATWGLAGYATLAAASSGFPGLVVTLVAAAAAVAAPVRWHATSSEHVGGTLVALVCVAFGALAANHVASPVVATWWVVSCFAIAAILDGQARECADVARALAFAAVLHTLGRPGADPLAPATTLLLLGVVDTLRTRRFALASLLALPVVQLELRGTEFAHLSTGTAGVALCGAAAIWFGLAALVDTRQAPPLLAAGGASAAVGLALASAQATTFGAALLVLGTIAFGASLVTEVDVLAHAGAWCATVGLWTELAAGHVQTSEWYVLPVVSYLLVVGVVLRSGSVHRDHHRPGSWVAYGPAVAMLAGSGVVERLHGGSAAHALFAGIVALVAVVAGGARRLAAPLVIGTAALGAITVHETISTAANVPLSAWLAVGGAALLGAAVAIERSDTSPIDAGRRVVDVLADCFD